jgi:hypothetical protein
MGAPGGVKITLGVAPKQYACAHREIQRHVLWKAKGQDFGVMIIPSGFDERYLVELCSRRRRRGARGRGERNFISMPRSDLMRHAQAQQHFRPVGKKHGEQRSSKGSGMAACGTPLPLNRSTFSAPVAPPPRQKSSQISAHTPPFSPPHRALAGETRGAPTMEPCANESKISSISAAASCATASIRARAKNIFSAPVYVREETGEELCGRGAHALALSRAAEDGAPPAALPSPREKHARERAHACGRRR